MKITDIIRRSGRSLKSAKMRTLLTATAIAIGGFTLIITLAATNGARAYVDKILQENFDPAELLVYRDKALFGEDDKSEPKEYSTDGAFSSIASASGAQESIELVSPDDVRAIKKLAFTESVTPVIQLTPEYISRQGQKKYTGSLQQLGSRQGFEITAGTSTVQAGKKQVLLPEPFVKSLGFASNQAAVGQIITIGVRSAQSGVSEVPFTVAGVKKNGPTQEPGTEFALYTAYKDVQALKNIVSNNMDTGYSTVTVRVKNGENEQKIQDAQAELTRLGFQSKSSKDLQALINSFISTLQIVIVVFSVITVVASIFGIVNTLYISVLERTREIGLMKALGMRRRSVNLLFIFEALWIGFIGGTMGILAGYGLGTLVNPVINKKLELGAGISLLEFKTSQMLLLVGALMVVAMIAGLLPARKASKLDPIEALRTE